MKNILLTLFLFVVFGCSKKIPSGTYRVINFNDFSKNHIEQYFTFDGNRFDKYQIRYGEKYRYDSISIIKYQDGNKFTLNRNDSLYEFYYKIYQNTIILKTGDDKIKMIKVD